MSPDADAGTPAGAERDACGRALRIAFAVSFGLLFETLRGAPLPPLAPLIALQLLVFPGPPPAPRMAATLLGLVAGAAGLAWLVSAMTARSGILEAIGVGLLYLWGFALAFRPRLEMAGVVVITMTVVVTSLSAISTGLSAVIILELMLSAAIGLALVWLAHAAIEGAARPAPLPAATVSAPTRNIEARALLATLILLPAHMWLNADGLASMVVLLTAAAILRQPDIMQSVRFGAVFAAGNALGGALAAATVGLLTLHHTALSLVTLTAAGALILTAIPAALRRGPELMLPAFVCYALLTGIALSPLPLGSEVAWQTRVIQIVAASLYALAGVSLLAPLFPRRERRAETRPE